MGFEAKVQSIVQDDEIDLDQLSPIEFLTSDKDSVDNENLVEILEEMDFVGDTEKEMKGVKRAFDGGPHGNQNKRQRETYIDVRDTSDTNRDEKNIANHKKRNAEMNDKINSMDEVERKAIGALFRSIKEMRRAAKFNLFNLYLLTRLKELVIKYPSLEFIYKVLKPVSEIMPDTPINMIQPILEIVGLKPTSGGNKYNMESVVKIIPKRFVKGGKIYHRCLLEGCTFERVSWGAVNTHIMKDHVHKAYVCHLCEKVLTSMDGLRHHIRTQHKLDNEKVLKKKQPICSVQLKTFLFYE